MAPFAVALGGGWDEPSSYIFQCARGRTITVTGQVAPPASQKAPADHVARGVSRTTGHSASCGSTAGVSVQSESVRFRNPILPGLYHCSAAEWKAISVGRTKDENDLGLDFMPPSL